MRFGDLLSLGLALAAAPVMASPLPSPEEAWVSQSKVLIHLLTTPQGETLPSPPSCVSSRTRCRLWRNQEKVSTTLDSNTANKIPSMAALPIPACNPVSHTNDPRCGEAKDLGVSTAVFKPWNPITPYVAPEKFVRNATNTSPGIQKRPLTDSISPKSSSSYILHLAYGC